MCILLITWKEAERLMNYEHLIAAKRAFQSKQNVVQSLLGERIQNEAEVIEIAYDLQAGAYSKLAETNLKWLLSFSNEAADLINRNCMNIRSFLDAGCGELNSTTHIVSALSRPPQTVLAFDISLSRLVHGVAYWQKNCAVSTKLQRFVAELSAIPLASNSVDVSMTVHALEPNRKNLGHCLGEIFRVTANKIFFFEPCYERASCNAQQRIESHGYIRNLENEINNFGGKILDIQEIKNPANIDNPTFCFIVEPGNSTKKDLQKIAKLCFAWF